MTPTELFVLESMFKQSRTFNQINYEIDLNFIFNDIVDFYDVWVVKPHQNVDFLL
jgi:hypothetical protein